MLRPRQRNAIDKILPADYPGVTRGLLRRQEGISDLSFANYGHAGGKLLLGLHNPRYYLAGRLLGHRLLLPSVCCLPNNGSAANDILRYSFLHVFANDRTIDAGELAFMERLAIKDGVVDEEECTVLSRIFARVAPELLTPEVRQEILAFKARYGIV